MQHLRQHRRQPAADEVAQQHAHLDMRKPRLNRLHDHADGERHAERRRVAAEEQAEAGRRQRVGGDQDALRKAGRVLRARSSAALGLLGAELAVFHLAGDFVDHRNAPAARAAAADAPHVTRARPPPEKPTSETPRC